MFLTRFRLNTARPGARRLLTSPQSLHAAVMSSFPNILPTSTEQPRILWRLDQPARAEVHLYVVSPGEPDLTHLVEQAGWPNAARNPETPGWESRPYGPLLERLADGHRWAFRLTANPVHSIRRKEGEPTKRTAHRTPLHQMGWLLKRQEQSGFRVLEKAPADRLLPSGTTVGGEPHHGDRYQLKVRDPRALSFGRVSGDGQKRDRVSLTTVIFDGHLEVTDAEALRRALVNGIGKGKAYGCGLMTLAPIPAGQGGRG